MQQQQTVTLNPDESEVVDFQVTPTELGAYTVHVDSLEGGFTVQGPATLYGVVTDAQTGNPVNGAVIELVGTSWSDTSDYSGGFRITGIEPGTYTVRVSHPDYEEKFY